MTTSRWPLSIGPVEQGINWIDTAALYGLGHSEEVVARALCDLLPSERPLVFTKCGMIWDDRGNIKHRLKADLDPKGGQ